MQSRLYQILDDLDISYEKYEHEPFFTCEESEAFYRDNDVRGAKCKSLFLRNRKGNRHYLALVESHHQIDTKAIAEFLGESQKMSFASAERLDKYLGLTPGSVTPFGLIHENAKDIPVIIDEGILEHEFVHFHPLKNTATLKLTTEDLLRFIDSCGNERREYAF